MNVVVTIFYALCLAWLVALGVFAIVKRVKQKKAEKQVKKDIADDKAREESTKKVEK